MAAALCFSRPESVYTALDRSSWADARADGEREDKMAGRGSMARYLREIQSG
jgi:hypothetical protein